ncbi:MAG TPA: hypothetical protein VET48_04890 [Steroidobacteraceae bacterium]|nr:hypothetical protein [Steroidobacteraceae bacterium]
MATRSNGINPAILNVLLIGGAIFVGYKVLSGLLDKFKQGTDTIAKTIGDMLSKWIIPPPIGTTGKYVLQTDGSLLEPASYPVTWVNSTDPAAVPYGGQLPTITVLGNTYVLGQHDANGNYPAHQFPIGGG